MSHNTALDILVRTRRLIAGGWTQEARARTASGKACSPLALEATAFCLSGAVERAALGAHEFDEDDARDALEDAAGWDAVSFNDTSGRTQADVLAVIDRAIEIVRAE